MKKKDLLVLSALILGVAAICVTTFAREKCKKQVQLSDSANAVIKKMYPSAEIKKNDMETLKMPAYEVELIENGRDTSVILSEDGTIVSIESEVAADTLPEKVALLISEKVKDAKVLKAEKEDKYAAVKLMKLSGTQTSYEVDVAKDDQKYEIAADSSGNLISMKAADEENDDESNENEGCLSLAQLPDAVKSSLQELAGSEKIDDIKKENEHGRMTYEAEVVINGQEYKVEIDSDGKILEKKIKDDKRDDDD